MDLSIITNNPANISIAGLTLLFIILFVMFIIQKRKLDKFLLGSKIENLGDSISFMDSSIKNLESFRKELEDYLAMVEQRIRKSTQAVHTVRFNPFKGTGSGGNQSFATAFINEHGDGVIFSSLYSRDHVSIFSKPIKNGSSEYELSNEEKEALNGALTIAREIVDRKN